MTERTEEELVRRVVTLACGVLLLTIPLLHIGLGVPRDWMMVTHLTVLGGAFAALGRTSIPTRLIVLGAAGALWVATVTSVAGAFVTALAVLSLLARSRLPEVVAHPGVWQLARMMERRDSPTRRLRTS